MEPGYSVILGYGLVERGCQLEERLGLGRLHLGYAGQPVWLWVIALATVPSLPQSRLALP